MFSPDREEGLDLPEIKKEKRKYQRETPTLYFCGELAAGAGAAVHIYIL